ncbi:hypothetical protein ASZ90_016857 [hydrocarbon metagenome]|uniref:Uncharacterized protein n=1 Tax=hydrocarbon metagenome TaxID=938273 RepID=A0A0W8EAS3_9ZZZZ
MSGTGFFRYPYDIVSLILSGGILLPGNREKEPHLLHLDLTIPP